jgi:prepilin-type N-terminal cleavage/methylation domain-containing protein
MPRHALSRRDPQNGKNGFSRTNGFTVIELMIALGIIAIITTLALPSYRMIIEKRQVTRAAEEIKSFLTAAQLEAVKRNEYVAVSFRGDAEAWCLGMTAVPASANPAGADYSCDCSVDLVETPDSDAICTVDGAVRIYQSSTLSYDEVLVDGSIVDGETFVFDAIRGFAAFPGDTINFQLLSDDGNYALNVNTTATGRVNVCSDTTRASKKVPGYDPC